MMRGGNENRRGFTLIELLVVMAILGLLALVAMPAAPATEVDRLDALQTQIEDACHHARTLARTNTMPHGVRFDVATNRVAVVDATGTAVLDPLTQRDYVVAFGEPGQPRGVVVASASFGAYGATAVFDSQGDPIATGTITIACGKASRDLQLDRAGNVSEAN